MDRGSVVERTWDGTPIAGEAPFACCVVVWREAGHGREFLLLHRLAPGGTDYEGDWAWTPPAGARQPGELPDVAAARELYEETGLHLRMTSITAGPLSADVRHYVAQAPPDSDVRLDAEHDRYVWLSMAEALPRCLPARVAMGLAIAADWIDQNVAR